MEQKIKKIWNAATTVIVTIAVIISILLVGVRFVGLQVFTVLSGSMEPTYHVGSLIYVKKVDTSKLQAGDPITFMLDEDTVAITFNSGNVVVTHRIVEVVPDNEDSTVIRYKTKGDANDSVDGGLVHYKNVIGSPIFSIPYLGYFADFIQNPPGTYIAISVGAVLLLLLFIPDLLFDSKSEKEKENDAASDLDNETEVSSK